MPADRSRPAPTDHFAPPAGPAAGGVDGVADDNTSLLAVLDSFRRAGYGGDLRPGGTPGSVRCDACGRENPAAAFTDLYLRRLEGASDPDDMVLVVAGRCPECGAGGSIVLGFGPASSETDADIVAGLPL